MRTLALAALLCLACAAAARPDDDPEPPGRDRLKLVGEWVIAEIQFRGAALGLPKEAAESSVLFRRDGTVFSVSKGVRKPGTWKADPRKSPGELDLTFDGKTLPGIYKLDKEVLTHSAAQRPDAPRPTNFTDGVTVVYKRKK